MLKKLDHWVAGLLIFSIIPSLTALSVTYQKAFGSLYKLTGPLNPTKFLIPLALFYIWQNRKKFPKLFLPLIFGIWCVGTFCTLVSGYICYFPSNILREWGATTVGILCGLSLGVLPRTHQRAVFTGWFAIVFLSVGVDKLFPAFNDWLYANIFDPLTREKDREEVSGVILTGIFGRQSLAKLLAWTPWFFCLAWMGSHRIPVKKRWIFGLAIGIPFAFILATTQRGPLLGALMGIGAFLIHQFYWARNSRRRRIPWKMVGVAVVLGVGLTALVVPRSLLLSRIAPLFGYEGSGLTYKMAKNSQNFRLNAMGLSIEEMGQNPLGNACIMNYKYYKWGAAFGHAHNFILQQFRERGWLWGGVHLALWILALAGAWGLATVEGAVLFAAVVCVLGTGLFDHFWQVINHAVPVATLLVWGLWLRHRQDIAQGAPYPALLQPKSLNSSKT